ncbi:MAG: CoA transferase [Alphaproteobacteria bacterium]|nr:CoA transferase [Alphaproteobacteria bacterium]
MFDATQGVAGPHCAMLLAQHGADVVKVEPLAGDWGRAIGKKHGEHCAYGLSVNRGKRSIALDLKHAEGLAIAQKLAFEADVVLESFRPGVMGRFGLDYASVKARNPKTIYLSVTGYGQQGPYSNRPVTDSVIQAYSGWMSINRDKDGLPQRISIIAIDVMTGLYAFQAVAPALFLRERTGEGQYLDVPLAAAAAAFQAGKMIEYTLEGAEPSVLGAPLGTFKTQDGFINMNARRDTHFRALCDMIGQPDWKTDPRFTTPEGRIANEAALMAVIRPAMERKTSDEWLGLLESADILVAKVNDYGDLFEDAQVKAVDQVVWLDQKGFDRPLPVPQIPGLPAIEPGGFLAHVPVPGEQTDAILAELGFDADRIAGLRADKAIR